MMAACEGRHALESLHGRNILPTLVREQRGLGGRGSLVRARLFAEQARDVRTAPGRGDRTE